MGGWATNGRSSGRSKRGLDDIQKEKNDKQMFAAFPNAFIPEATQEDGLAGIIPHIKT